MLLMLFHHIYTLHYVVIAMGCMLFQGEQKRRGKSRKMSLSCAASIMKGKPIEDDDLVSNSVAFAGKAFSL